jgi:hypothetical protein
MIITYTYIYIYILSEAYADAAFIYLFLLMKKINWIFYAWQNAIVSIPGSAAAAYKSVPVS